MERELPAYPFLLRMCLIGTAVVVSALAVPGVLVALLLVTPVAVGRPAVAAVMIRAVAAGKGPMGLYPVSGQRCPGTSSA